MKLILLLTILTGLALAFPWPSSTNVKRGKTCDDCKKRYDNCNTLVRTQNTWCEQICRKYTCKLDRICEECNNGFYNCTALLRVPTIPINESEEHTPPTKNKRYESVNLPTFVAPVADEVPQGLKTDLCPESFTCDKEGETVLRCLCGFCSVAPKGYCVPMGKICRVVEGRGQCVKP